jgi:coenzyme F420-reducing hydrogenase beta subunit
MFGAIIIKEDEMGMLRPQILEATCRNCGECTGACPEINICSKKLPIKTLALYTKNAHDRETCASGGVATTFSRALISDHGIVFGAGFDTTGKPIYKKAKKMNELEEFKGSKYVSVFPGMIYRDIQNALNAGEKCLYIGTPCCVAGLKTFLHKEYDNLITVDFICHGTPPFTYLEDHFAANSIKNYSCVSFRGKRDFFLTAYEKCGRIPLYSKKWDEDLYFFSYLQSLIHKEVCYSCKYACQKRVSDISIGDFWGIQKGALNGYKGKISVALINSVKGGDFFRNISQDFFIEEHSVDEVMQGNIQLQRPSERHTDRLLFSEEYKKHKNFLKAIKNTSIPYMVKKNMIRNRILKIPRMIKYSKVKRV